MNRPSSRIPLLAAGLGMLLLILDSRCAAESARNALSLCLKTVIPNLFPMFVLSALLVSGLQGSSGRFLSGLEWLMGLPRGGGCIFLLGIIGGFPVGAQCITQAVETGSLSRRQGERMLGFCNNCSPAFLFGIAGSIFSDPAAPLLILLIQLETAMLTAAFTDFDLSVPVSVPGRMLSLPEAVSRGCRSMASVCAWVILAGVVTGFLERWIFPITPAPLPQTFTGLLEITSGILGLGPLPHEGLRFVLCALFVCFGGICVQMQIGSLVSAQGLSTGACFRQKAAQAAQAAALAFAVQTLGPASLLLPVPVLIFRKIMLEKTIPRVYNGIRKGGFDHVVPKEN